MGLDANAFLTSLQQTLGAGIERNRAESQRQQELEHRVLSYLAEAGDPEVRQLAVSGLMELSQGKGGVLQKVFNLAKPNENLQKIKVIMQRAQELQGGMQKAGAPPAPAGSPGSPPGASAALPQPAEAAGAPPELPQSATAPSGGTPLSAGMPAGPAAPTNGKAAPLGAPPAPSLAGGAPGAPGAPAAKPQGLTIAGPAAAQPLVSVIQGMGPAPDATPPSREAVGDQVAGTLGYQRAELEDPNFQYQGGLKNPERAAAQNTYRQQTQAAHQAGVVDTRVRSDNYWDSVRQAAARIAEAGVRAEGDATRERIAGKNAEAIEARANKRDTATAERQALDDLSRELADADRASLRRDRTTGQPEVSEEQLQELWNRAHERYRQRTGKTPPGGQGSSVDRLKGAVNRQADAMARSAAARGPAASLPGAPPAPTADLSRVQALKDKLKKSGRGALTPEEFQYLERYLKTGR